MLFAVYKSSVILELKLHEHSYNKGRGTSFFYAEAHRAQVEARPLNWMNVPLVDSFSLFPTKNVIRLLWLVNIS